MYCLTFKSYQEKLILIILKYIRRRDNNKFWNRGYKFIEDYPDSSTVLFCKLQSYPFLYQDKNDRPG